MEGLITGSNLQQEEINSFKLISMTDFVLEKKASHTQIIRYAQFLKQPLSLGMFVPCDDEGNILKEPVDDSDRGRCEYDLLKKLTFKENSEKYQQAKDRILFEGYTYCHDEEYLKFINDELEFMYDPDELESWVMEDFVDCEEESLVLTEAALKQIGL